MAVHGKRYIDATRRFDRQQLHGPAEAVDLVKTLAPAKFDETVELAVRLGVDPRKADQIVRGTVSLPSGTGKAVTEFKGGRVEYRTDRYGNVHVPVGKVSFDKAALMANFRAVIDELLRAKPAAAKGRYMRSVALSSTMGPGVRVDPNRVRLSDEDVAAA